MIFGRISMNRTQKGSITVEAIVMLGLIATLTPILYKHVAERRQDIENINEANTLLLLKNAVSEYIEANKETLTTGTIPLAYLGLDNISGYQIGIRKDSSGNIDAMITGTGGAGNDLKAAKIASLLGISAGIYSAQNTEKAWGINGVWAENISNYGFSSLPTGIPVITTAYDKEEAYGLNEEQLKEFIENTSFEKVTAKQFCIDNPDIPEYARCISKWNRTPLDIILSCNAGNTQDCAIGFQEHYNQSCQEVWQVYHDENVTPISGTVFNLTNAATGTYRTTKCYFTSSRGYDPKELIDSCDLNTSGTCKLAYDYRINQTCEQVRKAYETNGNTLSGVTHRLSYKAYNDLISTACDLTQNPSLTLYFYQNTPNTYTFSLLNKRIKYRFEVCGGGNQGGRAYGGWSWGDKIHSVAQPFFVIVGGGGGSSYWQSYRIYGAAGGTEIRYGTSGWQDKHRILVGGGSSSNIESGGGGNNCGAGGEQGGCKGIGGTAGGNTPQTTINTGGNGGTQITLSLSPTGWFGLGGNGGGYGGGGSGGGACGGGGGGGGAGFGGGGAGGAGYPGYSGSNGDAYYGGKPNPYQPSQCNTERVNNYDAGLGASVVSGFGGGGGSDSGSGGGGYGGGAGGGGIGEPGGGGGRVCLSSMPADWALCDSSVWVFDEGGGETGNSKCSGNGWVKISIIDTVEDI